MHVLEAAWESLRRDFDSACQQSVRAARCQITYELNQFVRRLRQYQTEGEWMLAVLDAAGKFVDQVGVFALTGDILCLRGEQNLNLPRDLTFSQSSAAAFASAVESKDPVVALRTPGEVTALLSTSDVSDRAHLFPIVNAARVVAVIFAADAEYVDANALELIAGVGSAVLERASNTSIHAQISAASLSMVEQPAIQAPSAGNGTGDAAEKSRKRSLPAWADLSEDQRTLHIRAQRFSRVAIAEMQLGRPEACRAGREQNNLYLFLKSEIEKARETYRKQFLTIPSMVDYLHLELVRTAAEGDEQKLGVDYPGQLV
jgi:hypothetical protein